MNRSTLLQTIYLVGLAAGAGLAVQACAFGQPDPTGSNSSMLGGGGGGDGGTVSEGGGGGSEGGASTGLGDGDGDGDDYAYGYMFNRRLAGERHHAINLRVGASETIEFTWHNAAGAAPPADLWVTAAGQKLLQVSSVDKAPFVRAGLDVVKLVPGAKYHVVFDRAENGVEVSILDASNEVILHTRTTSSAADFVLPAAFWRAAVSSSVQ